ncbi:TlpA family protein disulfide reductase [Marinobacter adhaerens]|uniref:TlpA family protein disulfide reductase n=2 Tax=Marinobacter TaxID=2742 RepID=A0A851HTR0_9GAMM|nr:TlpA family protein disulfide reductase [Marinobacter adhaerens]
MRSLTGGLPVLNPARVRLLRNAATWLALIIVPMLAGCQQAEFERAEGPALVWEDLRGQWVLVNYWAEWCKPCLEEIPELNELDKATDITVLGVNFDEIKGEALVDLGKRMGIEYNMLTEDPAPEFDWKVPVALPATFVVGPDGNLLEARFGPQTKEEIRALISD